MEWKLVPDAPLISMPTPPTPEREWRPNWALALLMALGACVWALAIWGAVCLVSAWR